MVHLGFYAGSPKIFKQAKSGGCPGLREGSPRTLRAWPPPRPTGRTRTGRQRRRCSTRCAASDPFLLSQGSDAVAEVEFERAAGLEPPREQGGRAGLDHVRADQLVEPPGVGADRIRAGQGQVVEYLLGGSHRL